MEHIKTHGISLSILTLMCLVTGHTSGIESETNIFGPRILGGRNAYPREFPFQVSIQWRAYQGFEHFCGGSIIDSEHVLTAGQCVYGLHTTDLKVVAGVLNNIVESLEETKMVREVTKVYVHEEFNYDTLINDIAILKVSPGFPMDNPAVQPIKLRNEAARDGDKCTLSGWGLPGEKETALPHNLQVGFKYFIPYEECRSRYPNYKESIQPGMNCAAYLKSGSDACEFGSGGSLQCGGFLTGVVSWGGECASPKYPGVYVDVAYYNQWIEGKLRVEGKNFDLVHRITLEKDVADDETYTRNGETSVGMVHNGHKSGIKSETNNFGTRILGGRNAYPRELPFQVAIHCRDYQNFEHLCGGSIIDSEHVLTAGHCVKGLHTTDLKVVAGVLNNIVESSEETKVVRKVTKVYVHEEFNYDTLINDIAILKVSPAFPSDNLAVKPIKLRKEAARADVRCTVSGWGLLGGEGSPFPDKLQVGFVYFIPFEECRSRYPNNIEKRIQPGMICATYYGKETDARVFDSGGPLQCGRYLTGIVSWGDNRDSPKYPGVYTDVAYYNQWIKRKCRGEREEL